MRIDPDKYIGCGKCKSYCTMWGGVMRFERHPKNPARVITVIDEDECVECSFCLRSGCCPADALFQPPLDWPRIVRKNFSDPLKIHPETRIPGRGTEEMKTNDVTGRLPVGILGIPLDANSSYISGERPWPLRSSGRPSIRPPPTLMLWINAGRRNPNLTKLPRVEQ